MSTKPMFVRFEVTPEIVERAYETVKLAKEDGKLKKGANESTKAVERGTAKLLVIAQDVDPPEIVAHLPLLAEDRKITYVYVDSKKKLGESAGIDVGTAAVAIVEAGKGKPLLEEVLTKVGALRLKAEPEPVKQAPKAAEQPKKEAPREAQKEAPKEAPKEAAQKQEAAPKKTEERKRAPKKAEKAEKAEKSDKAEKQEKANNDKTA